MAGKQEYGAEFRRYIRQQRAKSVREQSEDLYYGTFRTLDTAAGMDDLAVRIGTVNEKIDEQLSQERDRRQAREVIRERLQIGFPRHRRKIARLISTLHYEGLGTQKNLAWLSGVREGGRIYASWSSGFREFYSQKSPKSLQDLLFHLAMSSIFSGGIGSVVWLRALLDSVLAGNIELIKVSDEMGSNYWTDLRTRDQSVVRNIRREDGESSSRLWRIDAQTLVLIVAATDAIDSACAVPCPVYADIERQVYSWTRSAVGKPVSPKKLCRIGAIELEARRMLPATQPMLPTVTDEFYNACITGFDFRGLTRSASEIPDNITIDLPSRLSISDSYQQNRHRRETYFLDRVFLRSVLRVVEFSDDPVEELETLVLNSSISARVNLISWYRFLLFERGLKTSSVATYHGALARRWLVAAGRRELAFCDEEQINDIFESLFDDLSMADRHFNYVVERAQDFYRYLQQRYDWKFDMPDALGRRAGTARFIRADVVPAWVVGGVVKFLLGSGRFADCGQMLALIAIISHRTGLRISEVLKLRLSDIEASPSWWAAIRESRFGSNKTHSARRRVPLGILLTPDELALFTQLYATRMRTYSKSNKNHVLIFAAHGTQSAMFDQSYVSRIISRLMSVHYGRRLVFHSLRHTALTALEVVMAEDHDGFARTITGYEAGQVRFIRDRIFGGSRALRYWILAGLAGHISPKSTLEHYLHATSFMFYRRLSCSESGVDPLLLINITGVSKTLITRRSGTKVGEGEVPYNGVCAILNRKIQRLTAEHIALDNRESIVTAIPQYIETNTRTDVMTCYDVLRAIERGSTHEQAAADFNAKSERVDAWVRGAQWTLSRYRTARKKSRLIDDNRRVPSGTVLTPGLPNSDRELSEALDAVVAFREVYRTDRSLLYWAAEYLLSRAVIENTGVRFSSCDDLSRFLSLVTLYFPLSRFLVTLHPIYGEDTEVLRTRWLQKHPTLQCEIDSQPVRDRRRYPDGRVVLVLRHPDEDVLIHQASRDTGRNFRKYSSHGLQFIFHMLSIMMPIKDTTEKT